MPAAEAAGFSDTFVFVNTYCMWSAMFRLVPTKLFFCITLVLTIKNSNAQLSLRAQKIADSIVERDPFYQGGVQREYIEERRMDLFLRAALPAQQLCELTNHSNKAVRCYAFKALTANNITLALPILAQQINDTTHFYGFTEQRNFLVPDVYIKCIQYRKFEKDFIPLNAQQQWYLDSVVIYAASDLYYRPEALTLQAQREQIYPRIRELLRQEKDPSSSILLARKKQQEDLPLLLSVRNFEIKYIGGRFYSYSAIADFPHPAFKDSLAKDLALANQAKEPSSDWTYLYKAVAAYNDDWALQQLRKSILPTGSAKTQTLRIQCIMTALQKNNPPTYYPLLWELWERHQAFSYPTLKQMQKSDSSRFIKLCVTWAPKIETLYQGAYGIGVSSQPEIIFATSDTLQEDGLKLILHTYATHSVQAAKTLIANKITTCSNELVGLYFNEAQRIGVRAFTAAILNRIKTQEEEYELVAIMTQCLLELKDLSTNAALCKILSSKGYLEEDSTFTELMRAYRVKCI